MSKSTNWKLISCASITLLAFLFLAPTLWTLNNPDSDISKMPKWMPRTSMKLGLDLRGGVHMVLGVDLDKVVVTQLESYKRSLEKNLAKDSVTAEMSVDKDQFELLLKNPSKEARDKIAAEIKKNFVDALEVVGETGDTLVTRLAAYNESLTRTRAIDQSIETIRNRIDEFGVAEPLISRKGDNQIVVQFPGVQESDRLKGLIGQTAQLMFHIVHECKNDMPGCMEKQRADLETKIKAAETKGNYTRDSFPKLSEYRNRVNEDLKSQLPPDTFVAFERTNDVNVVNKIILSPYLLSSKNFLSGEYIENAFVGMDTSTTVGLPQPVVNFSMNPVGAPLFGALTAEFTKYFMAIVLDGVVKSAPSLNGVITDSGQITLGRASEDISKEAHDLSIVLRAGALPASIDVLEERVVGPSIGNEAIKAGKLALLLTSALIFMFMWIYYGVSGLIGNLATLVNISIIFALLGAVGATLTLPGIAGIVLTIGMAVDALIIIYERMREEVRAGRNQRQVIEMGFDRAFSTILDSNLTTAIGAVVLLQYGSGSIRGFALTLLIGIVSNVFVATYFTKAIFDIFVKEKNLSIGMSKKELAYLS